MKPWQIEVPSWAFTQDRKRVKQVFTAAGREIAAQARRLIVTAKKARGQASKPGNPPHSRTGALRAGIRVKPIRKGLGVTIKDSVFYAKMLETGAVGGGRKGVSSKNKRRSEQTRRYMAPRPFLSTAFEMRKASIEKRVVAAIQSGLKFQKAKLG